MDPQDLPTPIRVNIPVLNPGWNREDVPLVSTPPRGNFFGTRVWGDDSPWAQLQWWESPLQARQGVVWLARRPFLELTNRDTGEQCIVPTRMLYPDALRSRSKGRIKLAGDRIAALVRQARELYMAAETRGVTDLSRPLLYFYGAAALAKAATTTLFGAENPEKGHGLSTEPGAQGVEAGIIKWQARGTFAMFCRTTRTDDIYGATVNDPKVWSSDPTNASLRFHALECIRALGYDWGLLPPAIASSNSVNLGGAELRGNCLLPHRRGDSDVYMTPNAPLNRPVVQVTRVIVQYMLLYYFSMLARYEAGTWQTLLEGRDSEEGYVYRAAVDRVAYDFAWDMVALFPSAPPRASVSGQQRQWCTQPPTLAIWFHPPSELQSAPTYIIPAVPPLEEWDG